MENIVPQVEEVNLFGREQLPWCDATFKATKYKPWLNEDDSKDVLFVSVHGFGARNLMGQGAFYPGKLREETEAYFSLEGRGHRTHHVLTFISWHTQALDVQGCQR